MAKQLHIRIPEPCHENWNEMTPTAQGAFCKSCNKNVIDFSTKTENEIYEIISGAQDKLCGRFTAFQLAQPIRKTELKNGWLNWRAIAASLAAFFSFGKLVSAGDLEPKQKTTVAAKKESSDTSVINDKMTVQVTGNLVNMAPPITRMEIDYGLKGRVIDGATKEALFGANVYIKNTGISAVTDLDGYFILRTSSGKAAIGDTVVVNYIGYKTKEFAVRELADSLEIQLEMSDLIIKGFMVGDIVKSYGHRSEIKDSDDLLDRYDPKLDIRKKVREKAKKNE